MNHRMLIFLGGVLLYAAAGNAAELAVGPGRQFARIEAAVAAAKAGDTVLVFPQADNRPYERPALYITTPRLTLKASGGEGKRVRLSGEGFVYSGSGSTPRAIVQFNPGADGCVLEGFELYGAHNGSQNGAGVRINQANDVTVRDCHIQDNDMGIMSNGDGTQKTAVNQLIQNCLIHSNGNEEHAGYNHNLYLGGTSVRLVGCEIHSNLTGHNLKSRAHQTIVLGCYIHDSCNRELDLVDGTDTAAPDSHAAVVGCVIAKDPKCRGNRGVIHFGQDGGNEHDGTIYLAHNTIVTPFIGAVVTLSAPKARVALYNNIVWDSGSFQANQRLVEVAGGEAAQAIAGGGNNWLSGGFGGEALTRLQLAETTVAKRGENPPLADPAKGDYRLVKRDPALVDAGMAALPPELVKLAGSDLVQFHPPLGRAPRRVQGKPDLGAYELAAP